ncbi:MAG: histidine kinase [Ignavibacteriaceae bacterium]
MFVDTKNIVLIEKSSRNNAKKKSGRKNFYPMNRKQAYWTSQLSGWIAYSVINIFFTAWFERITIERVLVSFCLVFFGIFLTHQYRKIIRKKGWLQLQIKSIFIRILAASIIIGLILDVVLLGIALLTGALSVDEVKPATPFIGWFNLSVVIFVWSLIYFSVHFIQNYRKAEIESLIWEAAVKDFELKTLKSQLNPHFMFNALNSIRALIEENPVLAKTAVTRLSNILRYSLKIERTETVALKDELQTVSDYLELESIRFEERLKFNIHPDPGSLHIEIPPMMIQTLVENGIKHGISKRPEGGEITVSTSIVNSDLLIRISNSGRLVEQDIKNSQGFGLNNTRHRLNLLYGEEAKFNIFNSNDDKVITEIQIPSGGRKNESYNN